MNQLDRSVHFIVLKMQMTRNFHYDLDLAFDFEYVVVVIGASSPSLARTAIQPQQFGHTQAGLGPTPYISMVGLLDDHVIPVPLRTTETAILVMSQ